MHIPNTLLLFYYHHFSPISLLVSLSASSLAFLQDQKRNQGELSTTLIESQPFTGYNLLQWFLATHKIKTSMAYEVYVIQPLFPLLPFSSSPLFSHSFCPHFCPQIQICSNFAIFTLSVPPAWSTLLSNPLITLHIIHHQ